MSNIVLGGSAGGKTEDFKDALEQPLKNSSQTEGAKAPGSTEQGTPFCQATPAQRASFGQSVSLFLFQSLRVSVLAFLQE